MAAIAPNCLRLRRRGWHAHTVRRPSDEFPAGEAPTAAAPSRRALTAGDFALFATVVLIWGLSWICVRFQVGVVAPEISGLWRFAMSAPLMFGIAWLRGERFRYDLATHARFALLALTMFSINFVVVYYAAHFVTTGLIATSFSLAALVNIAMGALILRAPIDPRVVLGGAFGVAGVALMFYPEVFGANFGTSALIGFGLSMICTVSFSLGNIVSVSLYKRGIPIFVISGYGMLYGSAFLTIEALIVGHPFIIEWTVPYIASLLYLAILGSVVAFMCYFTLLNRIGPDRAGYVTVLQPVVALMASTLIESYVWTLPAMIGIVAVIVGNVLVLRRPSSS